MTALVRTSSTRTPLPVSFPYAPYQQCITNKTDSPNTLNKGFPQQANQEKGRGFFTAPGRKADGSLVRKRPQSFADHWSQPRLFFNSLSEVEQQFLIDAIRFETAQISPQIQENILKELNKISHDIAVRVGAAIGVEAPEADPTYYHDNTTAGLSIFGNKLPTIATLNVGILASNNADGSLDQATSLKEAFAAEKVNAHIVAETLGEGIDQAYTHSEAIAFDGIIVTSGAEALFNASSKSPLFPPRRPIQIVADGYNWGKPVGFLGGASAVKEVADVLDGPGVYTAEGVDGLVEDFKDGLATFKFTDRFAIDE